MLVDPAISSIEIDLRQLSAGLHLICQTETILSNNFGDVLTFDHIIIWQFHLGQHRYKFPLNWKKE